MQLVTIAKKTQRDKSSYKKYIKDDIQCLQQSECADNDCFEFLKPMAEYIALRIIDKL
ncbi:MAG: hypothetical protein J6S13_06550 [Clostridia bacterium]|nr:hypothetical protein [Clostridia bacterium]